MAKPTPHTNSFPAQPLSPQPASELLVPNHQLLESRKLPAWLLSCLLHTVVFVALILLMAAIPVDGASEVENKKGGIVLVKADSQTTEYLNEGDVTEQSSAASPSESAEATTAMELPPELPGVNYSTELQRSVAQSAATGIDGTGDMTASQSNVNIGGAITTEVFGVEGTGSRFVYVIDHSESMSDHGHRPMLAARQQLIQSLESLGEHHQFQIIFYNNKTRIFNPDGLPDMYSANDEMKTRAIQFVKSIKPQGGTDHLKALMLAFQLQPDVIFFLTDAEGGFTNADMARLSRANRSAAVVNMIEFGQHRGRDRSLQAVASQTGGHYLFKNINSLRVKKGP